MLRIAVFTGALALAALPQPAQADPAQCGPTVCAHAAMTLVQNGPCTGGPTSWSCPWRMTWTAGATSSLPGSMTYNVYTTPNVSGTCEWLVGGCNPPPAGESTGIRTNVPCGGTYHYMSMTNSATAGGLSVSVSDSQWLFLKPTC